MTDLEAILSKTTYNAGQWGQAIEDYVRDRPYEDPRGKAVSKALPETMRILREQLVDAIAAPAGGSGEGEFDTAALREPLLHTFANEEIFQVFDDVINLEEGALELAGDWQDWADGIAAARENLGLGKGKYTKKQRAKFWRDFVYGPARIGMDPNIYVEEDDKAEKKRLDAKQMYEDTIQARLFEWEGGAPYWLILEYGNQESNLAFPRFRGTHFLDKTRHEAQRIYDYELYNVFNQEKNIVFTAVENFLDNPDTYEAFDPLATFYADAKKYYVYVTRHRRIGVTQRIRRDR